MNLEITGKLVEVYPAQVINDRLRKAEFVLEIKEQAATGTEYTNYCKLQLTNARCELINRFQLGDTLKVQFNIRGTRYEKDGKVLYISNMDAWSLSKI